MEKQELHIDFKVAKAAFEKYLDEYDRTDDKIHLKIVHTYCVVDAAEEIATRMHLREEDVQLAKIIGLLHDIGRYEELTCGTPHDAAGAELAEEILTDCGFAAGDIGMIKDAIAGHRNKAMCGEKLADYLYRADKQSRCCFACSAADECKWSDEKKNHVISI